MKQVILIFALFLSSLFCDRAVQCEDTGDFSSGVIVESEDRNPDKGNADCKSFGILPSRTAGYTGESNSVAPSVRLTNSGRRLQPSGKAPFRVIKDGKVIDRHNFHTFQTSLKEFPSGIHSTYRYIHSICQLLI